MEWKPQKHQIAPLASSASEIFFGGGRGSGKTETGLAWLSYDVDKPQFRALVIRRNADDLKDWIDRASIFFSTLGAEKTGNPASFTFPSGAIIRTGHLNNPSAFEKYQGHQYHRILIEEIAQIPREETYVKLLASNRTSDASLPAQCFSTGNPSGPGFQWVKERFVDPSNVGVPFLDPISGKYRVFYNGTIDDNVILQEADPSYSRWLDSLPVGLREAWRHGLWTEIDAEGAYWANLMHHALDTGRICSLQHDPTLPVHTYWDLGFNDSNAIWLVQLYGKEVRVLRYYEDAGKGLKDYLIHLLDLQKEHGYKYGKHHFPHDMGVHEYTTGTSREQAFCDLMETYFHIKPKKGVDYEIVPRMRSTLDGIEAVRLLIPYCYFDREETKQGVHALKSFQKEFDEKKNRFKDTPLHDWSSHGSSAFMLLARTVDMVGGKKLYGKDGVVSVNNTKPIKHKANIVRRNYLTGEFL